MIEFSLQEREALAQRVREYLSTDLNIELGRFDAEFLVDFFTKEIGAHYYNHGLYDAQAALEKRIDDLRESIMSLEKHTS
ncbi:MAG: DUF2164 domain-containing protein [Ignavibacteria bacterium]